MQEKLGILVGGGPAPGNNSVIGAATIRARVQGIEVLGIRDGFEWIMQGDIDHVVPLDIVDVSRIHFRGGSHIGISRANPTANPEHLENALLSLLRLGVSQLITIGGDDTAFSAMKLEEKAAGRLRVVHVPKRQRPRPAAARGCLRLPDRAPHRRGPGEEPHGGRQDPLAVVLRHRHGPQGRPPGPRHRQGGRLDHHPHPGGVLGGARSASSPSSTRSPDPSSSASARDAATGWP